MNKKIITVLLAVFMAMATFTVSVFAEAQPIGDSDATWELTDGNAVLTIGGTGDMPNFSFTDSASDTRPWKDYKDSITSVVIGNGITSIGKKSFLGFSNLTDISIPNTVTMINQHAFNECTSLTSVELPNALTHIYGNAFDGAGLTSVTIPASVTSISSDVFKDCNSLSSVKVLGVTPPSISGNSFPDNVSTIYVPAEAVEDYKNGTGSINWILFKDKIQAIPVTIADILPDDFPTDPETGWANSNDAKLSLMEGNEKNVLYIMHEKEGDYPFQDDVTTTVLTKGTNNYSYTNGEGVITTFNMDDNTLVSITINNLGDIPSFNGTYASPVTVSFDLQGHGADIQSQTIVKGTTATKPANPTAAGYKFDNWYENTEFITPFDFSTPITKDLILYANWKGLTISDVLETNSDFPKSKDNAWVNDNGIPLYASGSYLKCEDDSVLLSNIVSSCEGGYTYTDLQVSGTYNYKFNMSDGKLTSVTISGYPDPLASKNGTYTIAPAPLSDVSFNYSDFDFSSFTFEMPISSDSTKYIVDGNGYDVGLTKGENIVYYYDNVNKYWVDDDGLQCTPDISKIDKAYINFKLTTVGANTFAEETIKVTAKKGTSSSKELNAVDINPFVEGFELDTTKK